MNRNQFNGTFVALIRNAASALVLLGLYSGSHHGLAAEGPSPEQIQIQREANQMVHRWRERYPKVEFSLLLTSDPEEADRLAARIARFAELESYSEEMERLRHDRDRLNKELATMQQQRENARQEVADLAERGRRLMQQLGSLQEESKGMEAALQSERDRQNRLIADRARLQSDIQRYRRISERLSAALSIEEPAEPEAFSPPRRLIEESPPPPQARPTIPEPVRAPESTNQARSEPLPGVRDLRQLR